MNGPEILDKYVGESEANIRKLFQEAEEDERKLGREFTGSETRGFLRPSPPRKLKPTFIIGQKLFFPLLISIALPSSIAPDVAPMLFQLWVFIQNS